MAYKIAITSLIEVVERAEAATLLDGASLHDDTVKVHFVRDPRIEQGSSFEELNDGTFFCPGGNKELYTFRMQDCVDFLVREYPSTP